MISKKKPRFISSIQKTVMANVRDNNLCVNHNDDPPDTHDGSSPTRLDSLLDGFDITNDDILSTGD